jgi:lysophospholipase L1-like esterase
MKTVSQTACASLLNQSRLSLPRWIILIGSLLSPFLAEPGVAGEAPFYLKSGDNVCFYGDSITEQRYYGVDVETFVRTRFPGLHVKFVNSGVGGDKVTGGWAGGIDERLQRDVFPFKPNIVTIMLGMNDGRYQPFDPQIFAVYTNGYEHIIQSLQEHLPGVRIILIEPTPYDDVTEPPKFPGGYNGVLLRYAAFVRHLAAEHHLMCVDFMTPMLDVMKKSEAQDSGLAHEVIPGRVHPSAVGELIMAQALLTAWNAPAVVTAVAIDAADRTVIHAENTAVDGLATANGSVSWTQNDQALPFPILGLHEDWWQFPQHDESISPVSIYSPAPAPQWDYTNAAAEMIVRLSGFYSALDQETLKIQGLEAGKYQLRINDKPIGQFGAEQLESGINLAQYDTPMLEQAYRVLDLVWKRAAWRFFAWRGIQIRLAFDDDTAVQKAADSLMAALHAQKNQIEDQEYIASHPQPTHYELVRVTK